MATTGLLLADHNANPRFLNSIILKSGSKAFSNSSDRAKHQRTHLDTVSLKLMKNIRKKIGMEKKTLMS
jgi:hypothetical protein